MNKVILATGLDRRATATRSRSSTTGTRARSYEIGHLGIKMTGPYAPFFWFQMFCNVLVPQIFWFRSMRRSLIIMWIAALFVNVGMWLERFNIIVISLHRDFIPGSWSMYAPTFVDIALFVGHHLLLRHALPLVPALRPVGGGERDQGNGARDEAQAHG